MESLLLAFPFAVAGLICLLQKDRKAYLKRFGMLAIIGLAFSAVPWMHFGIAFGYYSYTLNAAFLASIVEFKEKK